MKRIGFFTLFALVVTSLFLTIEWFTIWAWISLSILIGSTYDCFYTSQENNAKIAQALLKEMEKLSQQCTRMSTIMGEVRDNIHPKNKIDSNKFKK